MVQRDLFGADPPLPEGFVYRPELIGPEEEARLLDAVRALPFAAFRLHGHVGRRRTVSYGWGYDFEGGGLSERPPIPDFLLPLRERAAAFAGLPPGALPHALVTEYQPGAPIGWHRDRPEFGDVIGVSLLAGARFRLRRRRETGWERADVWAEPRSAYLLRGPSRTEWEHGIPPVPELRYSVTFRTVEIGRPRSSRG